MDTRPPDLPQPVGAQPAPLPAVPSPAAAPGDALWYKDAVIYQLHVKAFFDSNDDGIGDFRGLTAKLDYIADLGVNTVWLLPFYPSPLKDDGYDVADYRNVHPHYGTLGDFRVFVREAHRRGLRVITELVVNHTSDQHPWFQAARRAPPGSSKRNFYVWSDTDQKYLGTRIIFKDTETSNWAWDPVAKAYYWHRFFSHQPDLNYDNPRVLKAVFRIMRFWLDMGVDGFRLDAVPYLCEREGTSNENLPETHAILKKIRAALDARYKDRMFLAEANQWPEDVREYFGDGDECHMAYHFPLMPRMYMAIAQEDRHPIVDILQQTPEIPESCQWAIFLRNHDELTLEMVTNKERDYMYRMYAADPAARLNLGIRRRLAPLMENDLDRIKLMNSLLLSMPGSPIIYYGDEIGMGDNIFLGDRNGVRTPMQWSPDRNAGFSRADPQRLYLAPIMDPIYGYQSVNVEAQARNPSSLLNWMRRMLAVRKAHRAFGRGRLELLRPGNRKVLAMLREYEGGEGESETILCVANLSRTAQAVELDLARYRGRVPVEMLGRTPFPPIGELPYMLTLSPYAFYWFTLSASADVPSWHEERLPREDLPVLILFDGWSSFFRDRVVPWRIAMAQRVRAELEEKALPGFLESQRWFASKGERARRAALVDHALWSAGQQTWMLSMVEVQAGAQAVPYFVPMALAWEDVDEERMRALGSNTIARVRQQAQVGVLGDAFADEPFCRALVEAVATGAEVATARGRVRFRPTAVFAEIAGDDWATLPVGRPQTQSSNTLVTLGERLFLKAYRRVRPGENPELEVGRFLTEVARFAHCVPLAGYVEYLPSEGEPCTLALVQAYAPNQGDGWTLTLEYLARFLAALSGGGTPPPENPHGAFLELAAVLGRRTAELHRAFAAAPPDDPAFRPEEVTPGDLEAWRGRAAAEAQVTFEMLARHRDAAPTALAGDIDAVLASKDALLERIAAARLPSGRVLKTRLHGDFHLGQVLLAKNDFLIIDFEGEPERPLAERRQKSSPLRDIAGMLRSLDYARAAALRRAAHNTDEAVALAPHAKSWEEESRRVFLSAYDEAAREGGLYESLEDVRGLLELFELEKMLYEVRYELGSRPEWVVIPLAALSALASAGPGAGHNQGGTT